MLKFECLSTLVSSVRGNNWQSSLGRLGLFPSQFQLREAGFILFSFSLGKLGLFRSRFQFREAGFIPFTVSGPQGRESVAEQSCSPQGTQEAENGGRRGSQDTPRNTLLHTPPPVRPHLYFQNLLREHHQLEIKPSARESWAMLPDQTLASGNVSLLLAFTPRHVKV